MLRLSWEQQELLDQIAVRRQAAGITTVLGQAWPALLERLQDRWPAFVEAAVLQGRRHGLVDPKDLARYAGLWCIWGPAFDTKPAYAWAAEILADARRTPALKLHQLSHRTRDELRKLEANAAPRAAGAAATLTAAQYDAAGARVEAHIGPLSAARSVFPIERVDVAVAACDLAVIDLQLVDPDGLQEYRLAGNGWHRAAVSRPADPPVKWTRAPDAPFELAVASRALRQGPPARLNLRLETQAVCDPRVHPEVAHVGNDGRLAWKGRDAARLSLALYAEPDIAAATAGAAAAADPAAAIPGIAAPTPFDAQTVEITSCGLRDAGAPFGAVSIPLRVYPATQWLAEIGHPAWPEMTWPAEAGAATEPPAAAVKLERDGQAADAAPWRRGWGGLHAACRQGFERVYNEWLRALGGEPGRLEVEASPLVGQAAFSWGWRRTAMAAVEMRTEGRIDMVAAAFDLRLSGELVDAGARSRVRLQAKGRSELRMQVSQLGETAKSESEGLKAVARSWRFPFTLELEPLAGPEPATLVPAVQAMPVTGALVGECGLRPRPAGRGLQWYFTLRLEPVTIVTARFDPLLGAAQVKRALIPGLPICDWSAG